MPLNDGKIEIKEKLMFNNKMVGVRCELPDEIVDISSECLDATVKRAWIEKSNLPKTTLVGINGKLLSEFEMRSKVTVRNASDDFSVVFRLMNTYGYSIPTKENLTVKTAYEVKLELLFLTAWRMPDHFTSEQFTSALDKVGITLTSFDLIKPVLKDMLIDEGNGKYSVDASSLIKRSLES